VNDVFNGNWQTSRCPEYWDGKTAARCVQALRRLAGIVS
jgi:hypothetical protein